MDSSIISEDDESHHDSPSIINKLPPADFDKGKVAVESETREKMARVKSSTKKKRSSKTAELEMRINSMEDKIDSRFEQMMTLLGTFRQDFENNKSEPSRTGGFATQREKGAVDNDPHGVRRPLIPLEPNLDEDLGSPRISRVNLDFDEISLQPNRQERADVLGLISDQEEENSDSLSVSSLSNNTNGNKQNRFSRFVCTNNTNSEMCNNDTEKVQGKSTCKVDKLSQMFKEEIPPDNNESKDTGLILDEAQIRMLNQSWRIQRPDRLTAFKDEYRSCFPLHEQSMPYLTVPSLDDLLEPMLREIHGLSAVKNWDKLKQLSTQPLKQLEKLAFQGQVAARMGLISILYLQQMLGTFLSKLQEEGVSDEHCNMVKDLFAISTKSLDQMGRAGAYAHMIRRKCAASDAGISNLNDIQAKVLSLPLTGDGVFGKGLEDKLEKRKEQREQIKDLIPEFNKENSHKRKLNYDSRDNYSGKNQRINSNISKNFSENFKKRGANNFMFNKPKYGSNKSFQKDRAGGFSQNNRKDGDSRSSNTGSLGGFRIPRKGSS